jgi:hypothetical protein
VSASSGRHAGLSAALLLVAAGAFAGPGCVSSKYKLAPKSAAAQPPAALEIKAAHPAVAATAHTVIVFHGPGSWKKDAYWDEYVVTLQAGGNEAFTVDQVALVDRDGQVTVAGQDPWATDAGSRQRLKVARKTGRNLALGAGVTAAWVGSVALIASNITMWGGATNASAVAAGGVGFIGIPLVALGSGVRTLAARHAVTKEFNRRRLALPLTLAPGAAQTGSFFFPVTPAPAQLRLRGRDRAGTSHEIALDLAPLAGLHLAPAPRPAAAAPMVAATGQ